MSIRKRKIAIIGVGIVGSTTAFHMISAGVCDELMLVDANREKAEGEAKDLRHSVEYSNRNVRVYAGSLADCGDMDIIVITASGRMSAATSRLQLLEMNVGIMKGIVEPVMASGFHGHFIVISNPVDIMAYLVYKISGLPKNQVIGTGTALDSARLKVILSDLIDVDARSIQGYCMGEHGDSQMVPWSLVSIGGKSLSQYVADNREQVGEVDYEALLSQVRDSGNEVYRAKGATQFGIASATVGIIRAIVFDENRIMTVSTLLEGEYGEHDMFCSVPVIINSTGVKGIGEMHLTPEEMARFKESTAVLRENLRRLPPL